MNPGLSRFFWEGFVPTQFDVDSPSLRIQLAPDPGIQPVCSRCSQLQHAVHDLTAGSRSGLSGPGDLALSTDTSRRLSAVCIRVEKLRWLDRYARITRRLHNQVEALVSLRPIKRVSELTGLHWDTIKGIDRQRLAREVKEPDGSQIRRRVMDELPEASGSERAGAPQAICQAAQAIP